MKIDLGSGVVKREGFIRIDNNPKVNPDILIDMQKYVKKLKNNSVDDIICSHSIEFLDGQEIYEFMNCLHRIIKTNGKLKIMVTSIILPNQSINPKAWTVPLLKTHFSPDTFKCFIGGPTEFYKNVNPWNIIEERLFSNGNLEVILIPKK